MSGSPCAPSPLPTRLSPPKRPPQQRFLSPTITPLKAERPRWHWDTSGEGCDRAPSHPAGTDMQPRRVSEHNGTKKHPRNMPAVPAEPGEAPSQTLRSRFQLPQERQTPGRGAAGFVCSAVEFSLVYLNISLGIHRGSSLTNASTLRVKLF